MFSKIGTLRVAVTSEERHCDCVRKSHIMRKRLLTGLSPRVTAMESRILSDGDIW